MQGISIVLRYLLSISSVHGVFLALSSKYLSEFFSIFSSHFLVASVRRLSLFYLAYSSIFFLSFCETKLSRFSLDLDFALFLNYFVYKLLLGCNRALFCRGKDDLSICWEDLSWFICDTSITWDTSLICSIGCFWIFISLAGICWEWDDWYLVGRCCFFTMSLLKLCPRIL